MYEIPSAESRWFALHVRSRHEKVVDDLLGAKQYDRFLPVYRTRRQWADRVKQLELPLFPGYVFCRFDPKEIYPVITIPGIVRVVGFGNGPVPIEESEIAAVRTLVASRLEVEPWPFLPAGTPVRVRCGSLRGVEGTLVSVRGADRLVINVALLQRSCAVEIDRAWVERSN
jgi:transcription antitermination factor NusG